MTGRAWARLAIVLVITLLFQTCVLDQIVVLDAHPDAMVLIPIATGFLAGAERGAIFGFIAGLVADLVVPLPFGMSALTYVLVGFGVGLASALPGWSELRAGAVVVCALSAGVATLFYAIFGTVLNQPGMLDNLVKTLVTVIVGSLVLAPFVLLAVRWVLSGSSRSVVRSSVPSGGSATG